MHRHPREAKMNAYIALLRAVNVTGTGMLPMAELKSMCEGLGFKSVKTYIASGNVVFTSKKTETQVKAALEKVAAAYLGKPACVLVRTAAEMAAVLAANPFKEMHGSKTLACFLDSAPAASSLDPRAHHVDELIEPGLREIYIYYPNGQGQSRLRIPALKFATARNMNTVAKLAEMAAALLVK
jgi:uncharacterized protein (DUF1697 family)